MEGAVYLQQEAQLVLSQGNFRAVVSNAPAIVATDLVAVLLDEPEQTTGGYNPIQIYADVSASLGAYSETNDRWELVEQDVTFTLDSGGTAYNFQWVVIWQGRGATANKIVGAIDTSTDVLTVVGHGLTNGDRAFLRSTGSLPTDYVQQRNWVEVIDADTFKLHTNVSLTAPVDFSDTGTGELRLVYANGSFAKATNVGPTTISPGQEKTFAIKGFRKYG